MTRVVRARLDELELTLVEPFVTSFGATRRRRFLVLALEGENGETGWAECVAGPEPLYSSETIETARWLIVRRLLPALLRAPSPPVARFASAVAPIRDHQMAKATVEMALHDLAAKEANVSLSRHLGGHRRRVEVGVSVGIQRNVPKLLSRVAAYLDEGYRRVKLKVRPGWDSVPVSAVRRDFPDLVLWVDANQAYSWRARSEIARWAERWNVEQVEQPFPERSIRAHARLQEGQRFRVCLDESVVDRESFEDAVAARALRSLNVKPGRVGGHRASKELGLLATRSGIRPWVGGMLESGIGRAHLVALASRREFALPGDISASARYYDPDLIDPPFTLGPGGTLEVPRRPGIGVAVDERQYRRVLRRSHGYGR